MRDPGSSPLLTDLYQLTMLQAYRASGMSELASFELFVRALPAERNFLLAGGLEQAVEYLLSLRFLDDELEWLGSTGRFDAGFLESLRDFRFTGDVDGVPEGTLVFANEPLLRVTAPLREAQLVETRLLNLLHFQTLVASKAARCVLAAGGRPLVDFGLRRAHGAEAGLLSARASYLAGFAGTATLEAARDFGIPVYGTMAHSFVQAHDDEAAAFVDFARSQPDNATLLIDTYDTALAARKVVALAREGLPVQGVRIDSGDLAALASEVRRILDDGGLPKVRIFASGNLDEYRIKALIDGGAPIDAFGVGTRMNVSADAPFLDCAYKMVEYAGRPRRKRSEGKATWPGRKQVYRRLDDGEMIGDTITVASDAAPGVPLLEPVLRAGRRVGPIPALDSLRARARQQLALLPAALRSLQPAQPYPVSIAAAMQALAAEVDAQNGRRESPFSGADPS
jgi:nicotinate phosphoribosyltransferase